MYLCEDKEAPGTANRQTECTGCPKGSPKGLPCHHYNMTAGQIHTKLFLDSKRERKRY